MLSAWVFSKKAGKNRWSCDDPLFWKGKEYDRFSESFRLLIDDAFFALYNENRKARSLLIKTKDEILIHRIGVSDPAKTILTGKEFIDRLVNLRSYFNLGIKGEGH